MLLFTSVHWLHSFHCEPSTSHDIGTTVDTNSSLDNVKHFLLVWVFNSSPTILLVTHVFFFFSSHRTSSYFLVRNKCHLPTQQHFLVCPVLPITVLNVVEQNISDIAWTCVSAVYLDFLGLQNVQLLGRGGETHKQQVVVVVDRRLEFAEQRTRGKRHAQHILVG